MSFSSSSFQKLLWVLLIVFVCSCFAATTTKTYQPLPETAKPVVPPDPAKGYALIKQTPNVYFLSDGIYWSMVLVSKTKMKGGRVVKKPTLCVIDAPTGLYTNLTFLAAVREVQSMSGAETVTDFVYSHHHTDHIGMTWIIKQNYPKMTIHANSIVTKRLMDRNDPARPIPNKSYPGNFTLSKFGLKAYYLGEHHTQGNLFLHVPNERVLMVVDLVFPGWVAFQSLAQAEFAPAFIDAPKIILSFDFDVIVGGHVTRVGNRDDVMKQQEYLTDLIDNGRYAVQTVSSNGAAKRLGTFDPKSRNYQNYWAFLSEWYSDVDKVCEERMLKKWKTVLGAADVYTLSHCSKMTESLRID